MQMPTWSRGRTLYFLFVSDAVTIQERDQDVSRSGIDYLREQYTCRRLSVSTATSEHPSLELRLYGLVSALVARNSFQSTASAIIFKWFVNTYAGLPPVMHFAATSPTRSEGKFEWHVCIVTPIVGSVGRLQPVRQGGAVRCHGKRKNMVHKYCIRVTVFKNRPASNLLVSPAPI
jgi:hypothetical protein